MKAAQNEKPDSRASSGRELGKGGDSRLYAIARQAGGDWSLPVGSCFLEEIFL
jgi:hypothetical protein